MLCQNEALLFVAFSLASDVARNLIVYLPMINGCVRRVAA